MRLALVIPALNEQASLPAVIAAMRQAAVGLGHTLTVVVGDNGSTDATAAVAIAAGAVVVGAPVRGYGAACLAALGAVADVDVVVFADGDGADDAADLGALLEPIGNEVADLVIGSRARGARLGLVEPGALTRVQRFGNGLASALLRAGYGQACTDLGPFRAVRLDALRRLEMDDRNFGWTVQMQARAARLGLRVHEVAVRYRRRRAGVSKVSGDLAGAVQAGTIILGTLFREWRWRPRYGPPNGTTPR